MTLHTKRHRLQLSFTINHEFQTILKVGYSWQHNNGISKNGVNYDIVIGHAAKVTSLKNRKTKSGKNKYENYHRLDGY